MADAHDHTTTASDAGSASNVTATNAVDESTGPGPGDVTPSSSGPSMASSQTKCDKGSSRTQTANSPVTARGTMNAATATAATAHADKGPDTSDTSPTDPSGHVKPSPLRRHPIRIPIVAWAALTGGALVANLLLHNPLWAWYSFSGLTVSGVLLWLDHRLGWNLPDRLLWWAGIPLALHYIGGSLSGVHAIGGPNGLYYVFPWWDNVVHFLGAAAAAVLATHLLEERVPARGLRVLLAVSLSITVGFLVELYEFLNFLWLGTIDQGYYSNTMLDLYYNALGATLAAWAYTRPRRRPHVRPPPAHAP